MLMFFVFCPFDSHDSPSMAHDFDSVSGHVCPRFLGRGCGTCCVARIYTGYICYLTHPCPTCAFDFGVVIPCCSYMTRWWQCSTVCFSSGCHAIDHNRSIGLGKCILGSVFDRQVWICPHRIQWPTGTSCMQQLDLDFCSRGMAETKLMYLQKFVIQYQKVTICFTATKNI